jgi:hypothetical protein
MKVLISCTENAKIFIDKKVIFDEKNFSVCRLSANFVIPITFFPFNLDTFSFQVRVF